MNHLLKSYLQFGYQSHKLLLACLVYMGIGCISTKGLCVEENSIEGWEETPYDVNHEYETSRELVNSDVSFTPENISYQSLTFLDAEIGYAFGKFVALRDNYGYVSLFGEQFFCDQTLGVILLGKGYKLDNCRSAATAGAGIRKWFSSIKSAIGINAFYDYLHTKKADFNQVGAGIEFLSHCWEFHLNGYLPICDKWKLQSISVLEFEGGYNAVFRKYNFALRGIDANIGFNWHITDDINLYIAPGGYYYDSRYTKSIQGGELLAELNIFNNFKFKVNASYDNRYKGAVQGIVSLNIPLDSSWWCCESIASCWVKIMEVPFRRNDMVFLEGKCCAQKNWNDSIEN